MKQSFRVPVYDYGITLTEIPDEISLYFNLGNCECHCKGCHSDYLWDTQLNTPSWTVNEILSVVKKYHKDITAVVFMGGNRNHMDFEEFAEKVLKPVSSYADVGLYLGAWDANDLFTAAQYCRWVKVGCYKEDFGGLDSPTTNQIFFEVQNYKFIRS